MITGFIAISALSALIYGVFFCQRGPSALRSVLKTAGVALLACAAALADAPVLIVIGLGLSAIGDLALSRDGDRAFLIGLGSFALAHLAYILLFAALATGWPAILPGIVLIAYAISSEVWLAPHTGEMRSAVRLYVVLITGMGLSALALPTAMSPALIGAGAFMASDTLLAIQLFRLPPGSRWHIPIARALWALYYAAQLLILWAFIG